MLLAGDISLGGDSKLTTVSINLDNGKVVKNKAFKALRARNGAIAGDFATKTLDFNDGTGGAYATKKSQTDQQNDTYEIDS
jgi:hypothetical protein